MAMRAVDFQLDVGSGVAVEADAGPIHSSRAAAARFMAVAASGTGIFRLQ
jgi:hypothetical protein